MLISVISFRAARVEPHKLSKYPLSSVGNSLPPLFSDVPAYKKLSNKSLKYIISVYIPSEGKNYHKQERPSERDVHGSRRIRTRNLPGAARHGTARHDGD